MRAGPPGVGKTTQLAQCLRDRGSAFARLDASRLGGEFEGQPARELDQALEGLRADYRNGPRPALVIDDLDMSIGVHRSRNYTVNTQLTTGWLMAQADRAGDPGFGAGEPAILVTGNDFSGVHGPLLRSGRARLFGYEPTPDEVASVLAPAFEAHVQGQASEIVRQHPRASVADFLEAISQLRDAWLAEQVGGATPGPLAAEMPALRAEDLLRALSALGAAK